MNEEDAFLDAILNEPFDDSHRLIYADWLEENGGVAEAARAEFIRLSMSMPDFTFFRPRQPADVPTWDSDLTRALLLCLDHWHEWTQTYWERLEGSPFQRWLGTSECDWGYRRGFVADFRGTQQVVLDARTDLFRLGPLENVRIDNLWHLGTTRALSQFLNQPCLRSLELHANELRVDDVETLKKLPDWLHSFERLALHVRTPDQVAARQLAGWLASSESLQHVELNPPPPGDPRVVPYQSQVVREVLSARDGGIVRCGLSAQFSPGISALAGEFGLRDDQECFREVPREAAQRLLQFVLHRELAYESEIMEKAQADTLAIRFLNQFSEGARFFTNGTFQEKRSFQGSGSASWRSVTESTFDTGVLILDVPLSGCLWVADED